MREEDVEEMGLRIFHFVQILPPCLRQVTRHAIFVCVLHAAVFGPFYN